MLDEAVASPLPVLCLPGWVAERRCLPPSSLPSPPPPLASRPRRAGRGADRRAIGRAWQGEPHLRRRRGRGRKRRGTGTATGTARRTPSFPPSFLLGRRGRGPLPPAGRQAPGEARGWERTLGREAAEGARAAPSPLTGGSRRGGGGLAAVLGLKIIIKKTQTKQTNHFFVAPIAPVDGPRGYRGCSGAGVAASGLRVRGVLAECV